MAFVSCFEPKILVWWLQVRREEGRRDGWMNIANTERISIELLNSDGSGLVISLLLAHINAAEFSNK